MNGNTKVRVVFFGTSDFAVPSLRVLAALPGVAVVAVVTQEDKPVGRKQEMRPTAVKIAAEALNLPVYTPRKLSTFFETYASLRPGVGVVVSYGKIIPQSFIDLPPYGIVNVHASLLPRWRGASPIQHTLLAHDATTGITIMKIDAGVDTGPLLFQQSVDVPSEATAEDLFALLAPLGGDVLGKALPRYLSSELTPTRQDDTHATYAPILKKEDGLLVFTKSAEELACQVRAFFPWPGSYFWLQGKMVKVLRAHSVSPSLINAEKIGILQAENDDIFVQTTRGILILDQIQLSGKKPQLARDFLNGHRSLVGLPLNDTKNP